MTVPHNPKELQRYMDKNGVFEVDQFHLKDWEPETRQMERAWKDYKNNVKTSENNEAFQFRLNLIDKLKPFVNKRGVRNKDFHGEGHEVRLLQLDKVPGSAKLVYRNHELRVGAMVPIYVSSKETLKEDVEKGSKLLYKKVKKIIL